MDIVHSSISSKLKEEPWACLQIALVGVGLGMDRLTGPPRIHRRAGATVALSAVCKARRREEAPDLSTACAKLFYTKVVVL